MHAQPEQACVIRGLDSLQERTILWGSPGVSNPSDCRGGCNAATWPFAISIWLLVTHMEANTHVIITRTGEGRVGKCTAVICRLVEVFAMICAALLLISVVL